MALRHLVICHVEKKPAMSAQTGLRPFRVELYEEDDLNSCVALPVFLSHTFASYYPFRCCKAFNRISFFFDISIVMGAKASKQYQQQEQLDRSQHGQINVTVNNHSRRRSPAHLHSSRQTSLSSSCSTHTLSSSSSSSVVEDFRQEQMPAAVLPLSPNFFSHSSIGYHYAIGDDENISTVTASSSGFNNSNISALFSQIDSTSSIAGDSIASRATTLSTHSSSSMRGDKVLPPRIPQVNLQRITTWKLLMALYPCPLQDPPMSGRKYQSHPLLLHYSYPPPSNPVILTRAWVLSTWMIACPAALPKRYYECITIQHYVFC